MAINFDKGIMVYCCLSVFKTQVFISQFSYFVSCQGFCSISRVGPQGICVWSSSLKGGAGNSYMPLHDHPYSDVNIIYSVVQTEERTTDRGTNSAPNIKRLCNGEYRPGQLYILSSRVAPDTTDADVHALCTKPAVLKMKESGKSSRNHRTVRGRNETCRHQVNERSAWLPQRSMKVNGQPHVFHLHNKKEKKSVLCKSESVYHKI